MQRPEPVIEGVRTIITGTSKHQLTQRPPLYGRSAAPVEDEDSGPLTRITVPIDSRSYTSVSGMLIARALLILMPWDLQTS